MTPEKENPAHATPGSIKYLVRSNGTSQRVGRFRDCGVCLTGQDYTRGCCCHDPRVAALVAVQPLARTVIEAYDGRPCGCGGGR